MNTYRKPPTGISDNSSRSYTKTTDIRPGYYSRSSSGRSLSTSGLSTYGVRAAASKFESQSRARPLSGSNSSSGSKQPVVANHSLITPTLKFTGNSTLRQNSHRTRTTSYSDYSTSAFVSSKRFGSTTFLSNSSNSTPPPVQIEGIKAKAAILRNASSTNSNLSSNGATSNSNGSSIYNSTNGNASTSQVKAKEMSPRLTDQTLPGGKEDAISESPVTPRQRRDSSDFGYDNVKVEPRRGSRANSEVLSKLDLPGVHLSNGHTEKTATSFYNGKEQQYQTSHQLNGATDSLKDLSLGSSSKSTTSTSRRSSTATEVSNSNIGNGLIGLQNIGNTCFMNSILQCLSNTKALRDVLLSDMYENELNPQKCHVVQEYTALLKKIWKVDNSRYRSAENPSNVKRAIKTVTSRFEGYSQHDAQEFLTYLLEGLHDGLNRVKERPRSLSSVDDDKETREEMAKRMWQQYLKRDNSIIIDLFVGQLDSCLICDECKNSSHAFDPFWSLALPIPQKSSFRSRNVDLKECFELFTQEETLDGDERPNCPKCKKRVRSTKRFKIQKFPTILIIHLKRFREGSYRTKLDTNIRFPCDNLDLSEFAADSDVRVTYNLFAVSNHTGSTYGGHYTADCKHPDTHVWHHYNDSSVSDTSQSSLKESEAYILFYELARG